MDPEPAKGYPAKRLTDRQVAGAAQNAGFRNAGDPSRSTGDIVIAIAVALAESGGNMMAHNRIPPDDSYGLWQINMIGDLGPTRRKEFGISKNNDLYDPTLNAKAAKKIKDAHGWGQWSTYKSGKYVGYMGRARAAAANPDTKLVQWQSPFDDKGGIAQSDAPSSMDPLEIIGAVFKPLIDFIKGIGLRLAGFIGGGVLIILAIVLYVRKAMR